MLPTELTIIKSIQAVTVMKQPTELTETRYILVLMDIMLYIGLTDKNKIF